MDIYYADIKLVDSRTFKRMVLEVLDEEYNMDIASLGVTDMSDDSQIDKFVLPVSLLLLLL